MKFTELEESKKKPDTKKPSKESSETSQIVDEEKLEVPKPSKTDINGYGAWYKLCQDEADRLNRILVYTYGSFFQKETYDENGKPVGEPRPTGAVEVYMDDDAWYFELIFDASEPYAFDTAMDIIADYKEIVGFPYDDAYIFESIETDDKKNFFRFCSWLGHNCNVTTADAFVKTCDWFDRIKQICCFNKEIPDEVILKRIELNNTWNNVFGRFAYKEESIDAKKKAEAWDKAIKAWKAAEYLKGKLI